MDWAEPYRKMMEENRKIEKVQMREKMLKDLKKKHFEEKQQEVETLKKRLSFLEKELESYK